MSLRARLLRETRVLIGVVHLAPLPGSPRWSRSAGSMDEVLECAAADARALVQGGADALIVENHGDAPFFAGAVPAETIAAMARGVDAVRREAGSLPVGVNVLRNDARGAVGLCAATGASFFRVNVHTGAAVTDQGVIEGRAGETLRARAGLAPEAELFADVHVKHAQPLGGGDIADAAVEAFGRGGADGLIVSGRATGAEADPSDVLRVRERLADAPILLGSGVTEENAARMLQAADGAIVGTWLKVDGDVAAPVDPARVARMRAAFDKVR